MAFGKKNQEEVIKEETKIWVCNSEDCNCWMRDNFKIEETPTCPICKSEMSKSSKVLQVVDNNSIYYK
ncbi:cold-shock protein [Thalassobacillus devorans]|uniref:Cold-shock protein n=1 Tax=Thalassobacillus devorans TaxID=279813 RepID=A0ABQ1P0A0_9BACI|nr:cold-shock protein [Thalassobacillus devorans]NIK28169.1 putative Zn-ribbon and HTH transcriptional regulator [Thalassobacillus devorans]GGC88350.1 cold-shock protein [Thalassobacillus devorans]